MTWSKKAIRWLILGCASLIVLANLFYYFPAPRLFVLWLAKRASVCTRAEAMRSFEVLKRRRELRESFPVRRISTEGELELYQTRLGAFWVPARAAKDLPAMVSEELAGIYSTPEGFAVHPGDVVIDCGANVGTFTRLALQAGASLVVAIEPSPQNVAALRRTFSSEVARGTVILQPLGVWDTVAVLPLSINKSTTLDSFVFAAGSTGTVNVPLKPLDQVVQELSLRRVDFIKVDVEGAELRAIVGARQTFARFRPRLVFDAEQISAERLAEAVRGIRPDYQRACLCEDLKTRIRAAVAYFF
ncbi:MAG: FkbM family methyltransferase [Bryobacteraceae bacterium]|jgi:FkbM family methyltransferase